MSRTPDRSLLPPAVRARLEAGVITNGEYRRLIPSFPDAALCDHAECYADHCTATSLAADPAKPHAHLHLFVLPELVARLGGAPVRTISPPDPNSLFRRLIRDWGAIEARVAAAIQEQRRLAALTPSALCAAAQAALSAAPCRWDPEDPVYDGTVYHTILPELIRRVGARAG